MNKKNCTLKLVDEIILCRSNFNVNFNVNFNIFFLEYLIVHPLDKNKNLIVSRCTVQL